MKGDPEFPGDAEELLELSPEGAPELASGFAELLDVLEDCAAELLESPELPASRKPLFCSGAELEDWPASVLGAAVCSPG